MKCLSPLLLILLTAASSHLMAQDTSCGIVWGPITNLSDSGYESEGQHVAVQGETVHVAWYGGGKRLPYRRSVNGGLTWEPVREMVTDTTIIETAYPWLVANSERVFLFYLGITPMGYTQGMYRNSTDRGLTWGPIDTVNHFKVSQIYRVSMRGDTITFQAPKPEPQPLLCLFYTTNAGLTWDSTAVPLASFVQVGGGAFHRIAPSFLIQREVGYSRSTDLGSSWRDTIVLSPDDGYRSVQPSFVLSSDNPPWIYTIWNDTRFGCIGFGSCTIVLRASSDGGLNWGQEYFLTDSPGGYNWDWGQQVATCGEKVAAAWANEGTGHIHMRYSLDRGDSWQELCDVTPGRLATTPSVTVTPGAVHVFWMDRDSEDLFRICYRRGVFLANAVQAKPEIPSSYDVLRNYPNPFNGETQIEYSLRASESGSPVTLEVFDLLGRRLARLVESRMTAGLHRVAWKANDVASGLYVCRLEIVGRTRNTRILNRAILHLK